MFSTQWAPYSPHSCTAEATRTNVEQWLIRSHRCYCSYYYRHHPQHRFYSYDLQSDFSWSTAILLFSFWGSVSWVGKPADTHTHTYRKKNKIRQNNSSAHTDANLRTHILSQVAGQSYIVRFASIPDGKAVLSVYLAPGHPWDSLSGFSLLPKTCSPVYLLIDSQRKAEIDSVAPTSLKSFLAKQALHAIIC